MSESQKRRRVSNGTSEDNLLDITSIEDKPSGPVLITNTDWENLVEIAKSNPELYDKLKDMKTRYEIDSSEQINQDIDETADEFTQTYSRNLSNLLSKTYTEFYKQFRKNKKTKLESEKSGLNKQLEAVKQLIARNEDDAKTNEYSKKVVENAKVDKKSIIYEIAKVDAEISNVRRSLDLDDAKEYAKMKEDLLESMILMKLNSISISPDREIPDDAELQE